jgi:ribonuclease P protein component
LLREAVRHRLPRIEKGWDLVFIARSKAEFKAIDAAIEQLLQRAKLMP